MIICGKNEHFQIAPRYKNKPASGSMGPPGDVPFSHQDRKPLYGIGMVENIAARNKLKGNWLNFNAG